MKWILCLAPLALAACGQPEALVLTPPADLLRCADAPAVPTLPEPGIERDRATVALWLAEREAGADCRARVNGVRAWVAEVSR
jgi:hypothetical protein